MIAAVTGATGFLGGALARALLARGEAVRVLVRRQAAAAELRRQGALPIVGDLTKPGDWDGLVVPGAVVFHAAARVAMSGRWEQFQRSTVGGTRNLLAAALPRRPSRFIYISSGAVYSPLAAERGLCADRSATRPASYNLYGLSKLAAERLVRCECERAGCPWTILRLGFMYGPCNQALHRHFIHLAKRNRLFVIGSGENRIASLSVDDAVRAAILAATQPAAERKIYDVASEQRVTQRQFIDATADALGLPRPTRRIGKLSAFGAAWMCEQIAGWIGQEPHLSRAAVALMGQDQVLDASRIRDELGWRAEVSFMEGMRRTQDWHRRSLKEGATDSTAGAPAPAPIVS